MSFGRSNDEGELREELARACQVIYRVRAAGDGLGGHLSARLDERRILIKLRPVSWLSVEPKELAVINFAGDRMDHAAGQSSEIREWPIHAQIYAMYPTIQCVLHAHPVASTLMAALGISVEPLDQDCAVFADRLPVLDNAAVSICTPELGDQVARALNGPGALLIKNHGTVVAGPDIATVCDMAHRLEKASETMLQAASITKLPMMSQDEKIEILRDREAAKPPSRGAIARERWRMMQSYYLGSSSLR